MATRMLAGRSACLRLSVVRTQGSEGAYEAVLAVFAADGTVDRRPLTIEVLVPPPQGDAAARALRAPLPENVAWNLAAAPAWLPGDGVDFEIPTSPQLAAQKVSGTLAGTSAVVGVTNAAEGANAIIVEDVPGSGEYTGSVSFGEGSETELTLRVADHVWALFLPLIAGLLLAHVVDQRLNRREPRLRLQIALQELRDTVVQDQNLAAGELRKLPATWPFPREPWRVWSGPPGAAVEEGDGLLAEEARAALSVFERTEAEEAKTTWAPGGAGLAPLVAIVDGQVQCNATARDVTALAMSIVPELTDAEIQAFLTQEIGLAIRFAAAGSTLRPPDPIDDVREELRSAKQLVTSFETALRTIAFQLENHPPHAAELEALREQLFVPGVTAEAINEVTMAARAVGAPAADAAEAPRRRELGGPAGGVGGAADAIGTRIAALQATLRRSEIGTTILAGIIVLAAALSQLYLANPTWGSLGDYLTALLWATVGTEAIKVAMRLIPAGSSIWKG